MKTKYNFLISAFTLVSTTSLAGNLNQLNSRITFCEEPVPVHIKKVSNSLHTALVDIASQPLHKITPRVRHIFNVIHPIFDKHQIPSDLMYLTVVESTLRPSATSPKGARGYWQFMPETAMSLGLMVSDSIDERLNLVKSTEAACVYFRQMYQTLGSWTLVAAAFNVGPNRVKQYIQYRGRRNYYDLNINKENRNYVFKVMAIKEMLTRPQAYNAMLKDSIDLQTHLLRDGIVLGLMSSPYTAAAEFNSSFSKVNNFMFLNEAIISGFKNIASTVVKKCTNSLTNRLAFIDEQVPVISKKITNNYLYEGGFTFFRNSAITLFRREDTAFIRPEPEVIYQFSMLRRRRSIQIA